MAEWQSVCLESGRQQYQPLLCAVELCTSDLQMGTLATTVSGVWPYWVSARTGLPAVSIL